MAFSFLQRGSLSDHTRQLRLAQYRPQLELTGLVQGVDNLRHDVWLSPRFREVARAHIALMLARYGQVEDLDRVEQKGSSGSQPPSVVRSSPFLGPSNIIRPAEAPGTPPPPKPATPADFKAMLAELHTVSLNRAKQESNQSIDMLARIAVLHFLRTELGLQFNAVLERCRAKAQSYEGPRHSNSAKAIEARERVAHFQVNKKHILRKTGQEVLQTLRALETEKLARLRRSLFGEQNADSYNLFLNRMLFADEGRDDYLNAENYVMLGNYDSDPDRATRILTIASQFLESIEALSVAGQYATYDAILSAPENAQELVGGGTPEESTAKGKAQRALLAAWVETLEREHVLEYVLASYEVVGLLQLYWPHIHAQQLKNALISREENARVLSLLEEHGKLSPDALNAAVKRIVAAARGAERVKQAGRFMRDLMRYCRDLRRLEAFNAAREKVNVITAERLRELSAINNTLYEFQLLDEQKPAEDKVVRHVILKADVRDSTALTRTLMAHGLNPASYFSLNFFDPVNKLLAKFGATKVFIEGDAVILALFEREGEAPFCVSRTCVLAREMIQIVHAYNLEAQKSGLPALDLGLGISFQDQAPLYLMDGATRIMISSALNESDRLSGCSKGARKFFTDCEFIFNVFAFQTVEDSETAGNPDEFLLRYNVRGICLSTPTFDKLRKEISLETHELEMPMLWGKEKVRLYRGLVPVGEGSFHTIVVREGFIPHIGAAECTFKNWTQRRYYEVCTNATVYELLERQAGTAG